MDLMGPMQTESLGGKRYVYVVVDDFEAYRVLLYMFLMMFLSLVYRFINCIMVSMLKHLASMCLDLGFICVL